VSSETICKNCSNATSNEYCAKCGEKSQPKRLTFSDVLSDFFSNAFTLEIPLLYTVKKLVIHPGKVAREFIEGRRKPYYKPFQFYLLILTIYYIFYYWLGLDTDEIMFYYRDASPFAEDANAYRQQEMVQPFSELFREYMKLLSFLIIPVQTVVTKWFFRKSGCNLAEIFVLWLYVHGILMAAGMLLQPLALVHPAPFYNISILLSLCYSTYALWHFFHAKPITIILKGIGITLLTFIIFGGIMACLGILLYFYGN